MENADEKDFFQKVSLNELIDSCPDIDESPCNENIGYHNLIKRVKGLNGPAYEEFINTHYPKIIQQFGTIPDILKTSRMKLTLAIYALPKLFRQNIDTEEAYLSESRFLERYKNCVSLLLETDIKTLINKNPCKEDIVKYAIFYEAADLLDNFDLKNKIRDSIDNKLGYLKQKLEETIDLYKTSLELRKAIKEEAPKELLDFAITLGDLAILQTENE